MKRLTTREVIEFRHALTMQQQQRCAICQGQITTRQGQDAVLDHCHRTGAVRGVLHRSCNALLGKLENNVARFGVRDVAAFCHGAAKYLQIHSTNITGLLHPSHLTDDEKRIKRNKQARLRAAKKKVTA